MQRIHKRPRFSTMADMSHHNQEPSPNTTQEYTNIYENLDLDGMLAGNTNDYSAIYNDLIGQFEKTKEFTVCK